MNHERHAVADEGLFPRALHGKRVDGKPLDTNTGPFSRRTPYVAERVSSGEWREAHISAAEAGIARDLPIFLAYRKSNPIVHDWHGDNVTFCPPLYCDLAIGSGACGLGCRAASSLFLGRSASATL